MATNGKGFFLPSTKKTTTNKMHVSINEKNCKHEIDMVCHLTTPKVKLNCLRVGICRLYTQILFLLLQKHICIMHLYDLSQMPVKSLAFLFFLFQKKNKFVCRLCTTKWVFLIAARQLQLAKLLVWMETTLLFCLWALCSVHA